MIVIKVELHPGDKVFIGRRRQIGCLVVANDETSDDPAIGHYSVYSADVQLQHLQPVARVDHFARLERPFWDLAKLAIDAAFPTRQPAPPPKGEP